MTTETPIPQHQQVEDEPTPGQGGRLSTAMGPVTWLRALALGLAFALLGGAIGWTIASRDDDPLSATDIGFMQDMDYHHTQAIAMSKALLYKDGIDRNLNGFAEEILSDQRFEQGLMNAIMARFGHPVDPYSDDPEAGTAMGWMGPEVPRDEMAGMATEEQMDELVAAEGDEAEALWIALMTEHHLGGLHMADYEARHGSDEAVRNLAQAMVKNQRSEVIDLNRFRTRMELPIPEGFADPMKDQRLNPLSLNED
ncbi:MAG: DUF305 domain-containing protein [Aquihabitans sp.]